jgi:hypothetical protein
MFCSNERHLLHSWGSDVADFHLLL